MRNFRLDLAMCPLIIRTVCLSPWVCSPARECCRELHPCRFHLVSMASRSATFLHASRSRHLAIPPTILSSHLMTYRPVWAPLHVLLHILFFLRRKYSPLDAGLGRRLNGELRRLAPIEVGVPIGPFLYSAFGLCPGWLVAPFLGGRPRAPFSPHHSRDHLHNLPPVEHWFVELSFGVFGQTYIMERLSPSRFVAYVFCVLETAFINRFRASMRMEVLLQLACQVWSPHPSSR